MGLVTPAASTIVRTEVASYPCEANKRVSVERSFSAQASGAPAVPPLPAGSAPADLRPLLEAAWFAANVDPDWRFEAYLRLADIPGEGSPVAILRSALGAGRQPPSK